MLNFADLGVFIVIAFFTVLGYNMGLVISVYKISSYFIAIWLALKLYPKVTAILMGTKVFEAIKTAIGENFLRQRAEALVEAGESAMGNFFDSVIESVPLPEFVRQYILGFMPDSGPSLSVDAVIENISGKLAEVAVSVFSLLIIFIGIRIALVLFKRLLENITKIPMIKQVDKAGGLILGLAEGILVVYFAMALLMLFNSTETFAQIYGWIETSMFARRFFENNFILGVMFPGS